MPENLAFLYLFLESDVCLNWVPVNYFAEGTKPEEPTRDVEDEISWKVVDQMHDATLQISNSCFEYKKLCVAVVAAVIALMVKFGSAQNLDQIMMVCLGICLGFWIADATAYYYQRRLRALMEQNLDVIAARNQCERREKPTTFSWWISLINPSMTLYYVLIVLIVVLILII